MPSINLLGQNDQGKQQFAIKSGFGRAMSSLGAILLLFSVFAYGFLAFDESRRGSEIDSIRAEIQSIEAQVTSSTELREILVRQGQVKGFQKVATDYSYWSRLLPELARVTLKTGGYASVNVDSDYQLRLGLVLPDFADFDKYLQVFDNPQFNKNLYNVRVVAASKYQSDQTKGVKVELEISVKPDLLRVSEEEGV